MTLKELYSKGKDRLKKAGIRDYQIDSFYLLEWVTGITKGAYFANDNQEVSIEDVKKYLALVDERSKKIPLQHLMGVQEFMGLSFQVTPDVLIPRQDSEVLVETALRIIEDEMKADKKRTGQVAKPQKEGKPSRETRFDKEYKVLDMCTGSGCIVVSILYYGGKFTSKLKGTGADICPFALIIAEKNSKINNVETMFIESDLFEKIDDKYQMIVANPPYIKSSHIEKLDDEVKNYDPILSLDGGEDGLSFYREIIEKSRQHLECGGYLLFEIGYDQGLAVSKKMKEYGYKGVEVIKDLANNDRVVLGQVSTYPDI